jgi:hypothetical protein
MRARKKEIPKDGGKKVRVLSIPLPGIAPQIVRRDTSQAGSGRVPLKELPDHPGLSARSTPDRQTGFTAPTPIIVGFA